ncbi:MAG: NADP-specific glutamate dehydrogenase [Cyclonatronaceae bacterium]
MPSELEFDSFMQEIKARDPHQPEFLQAVREVMHWVLPFAASQERYSSPSLLRRLCEPERIIQFRVPWSDDDGREQVNRGFRVQFNSAIGPYKGGLRFHPSVNQSILKFLAFEQSFKNSLTSLPLGGGKGGADFNPKGRSDAEVMRFCQSFMTELHHHIGPETDIPAGDVGVNGREIGFLFGQYKRLKRRFDGILTGKGESFGGSLLRPQATGYGLLYFAEKMMHERYGEELDGQRVFISGAGNVARHACQKALEMGARVLTLSDSDGYIFVKDGLSEADLQAITELKKDNGGRLSEAPERIDCQYYEGRPWPHFQASGEDGRVDIALPCATQNELDGDDAAALIKSGLKCLAEGANMPCTNEAVCNFRDAGISYAPGKASNAGGVSVSGLEMTQNAMRLSWTADRVNGELRQIMQHIHEVCEAHGGEPGQAAINYEKGAAIGGFIKLADAMLAQGSV